MSAKPEIIVVLSRFPYPLEKGDKLRAYYQIRELSEKFDIHLVAISDKKVSESSRKALEGYCTSIHIERINLVTKGIGILRSMLSSLPFQTGYFYKGSTKRKIKEIVQSKEIKHIYCQLVRTTELAKDIHVTPKTLDYMDALSTGIERRIHLQPFYKKWLFRAEAKRLKKYEQSIFDYFENKTIISEQDRELIAHPEKSEIKIIPNGVNPTFFDRESADPEFDFVFVGNMSYPPNIEAALLITEKILPRIGGATLLLAGATPHPTLIKIANENPNVTVSGWMDDIGEAYLNGKIFLAPMMIGTGMQNKLLEAMAIGTPCITTSLANNAIKAKHGTEIIVADDEESIISSCLELLSNEEQQKMISANAKGFVKREYSWSNSTAKLIELFNHSDVGK